MALNNLSKTDGCAHRGVLVLVCKGGLSRVPLSLELYSRVRIKELFKAELDSTETSFFQRAVDNQGEANKSLHLLKTSCGSSHFHYLFYEPLFFPCRFSLQKWERLVDLSSLSDCGLCIILCLLVMVGCFGWILFNLLFNGSHTTEMESSTDLACL